MADKFETIDEYIATFPPHVQTILKRVRRTIRKAAPGADEAISYQIPTFKFKGKYVVYFAGWKDHISVSPVPAVDEALEEEISQYRGGKGTLRFP